MQPQLVKIANPLNPTISPENQQTLVSNELSDARKTYALEIKNTVVSLFKREVKDLPTLFSLISPILVNCNLRSILLLRLVSKGFYHFLSPKFLLGIPSPLALKAITSFHFGKLYPTIDLSIHDQYNFSQHYPMQCIIKIKDHNELALFQTFLLDPSSKKVSDNIEVLDFNPVPINTNTAGLINTILSTCFSHKLNPISTCNTIIFGDIVEHSIIILPESFNQNTTLKFADIKENNTLTIFGSARNLLTFSIGNLARNTTFKLSAQLDNISSLTIGNVNHSTLELPQVLDSLTTLIIGYVSASSLILPNSLNNLSTLTTKKICNNSTIKLPVLLNNLKNLDIDIDTGSNIQLPESLDNLTNLSIKSDPRDAIVNQLNDAIVNLSLNNLKTWSMSYVIPKRQYSYTLYNYSLNNLTIFSIDCIFSNLKLSWSFHNLKTLSIGAFRSPGQSLVTLEITDDLTNLEILNIILIESAILKLSNKLNNLTTFAIKNIIGAKIMLPVLKNLTTLIIGDMYIGRDGVAELTLPYSLNNLTTLMIGSIGPGSIINLPLMLNNLRICTIKDIGYNVTLEFPDALDQLTVFTLGDMGNNSTLKLPKSLNNLVGLTLGDIGLGSQIYFPSSLKSFPRIFEEELFSDREITLCDEYIIVKK